MRAQFVVLNFGVRRKFSSASFRFTFLICANVCSIINCAHRVGGSSKAIFSRLVFQQQDRCLYTVLIHFDTGNKVART